MSNPATSFAKSRRLRRIARKLTTPPPAPGFAGPGHTAVEVVRPAELAMSDPFVLLMDDRLDFPAGQLVGGAHPHAGIETVTFVVEGDLDGRAEGVLGTGDLEWMTAGSGVIHNEEVAVPAGKLRVLQLWIGLPAALRRVPPRVQLVRGASAPVRREPGVEARVYSGRSGDAVSPTTNLVPVTLVDFHLQLGSSIDQELPAGYTGFLYVLSGEVGVGDVSLAAGQVGWLDRAESADSILRLVACDRDARVVLYAGASQGERLVQRGPFVAGSEAELGRAFMDFRAGRFPFLSTL